MKQAEASTGADEHTLFLPDTRVEEALHICATFPPSNHSLPPTHLMPRFGLFRNSENGKDRQSNREVPSKAESGGGGENQSERDALGPAMSVVNMDHLYTVQTGRSPLRSPTFSFIRIR